MSSAPQPVQTSSFQQRIQQVERLIEQIEASSDPHAYAAAQEVVRVLLELHAAGLEKMLAQVSARGAGGQSILNEWLQQEEINSLLLLHDLHPHDLPTRIAAALDHARPHLRGQGGEVELLEVSGDVVRLRLIGGGGCGCGSSTDKLRVATEEIIYAAAPEVTAIEIEEAEKEPAESAVIQLGLPRKNMQHAHVAAG